MRAQDQVVVTRPPQSSNKGRAYQPTVTRYIDFRIKIHSERFGSQNNSVPECGSGRRRQGLGHRAVPLMPISEFLL